MDANQICEDLKVAWDKKLLLIFMWVTDNELQLFMMHPEFKMHNNQMFFDIWCKAKMPNGQYI
jgi:hypothetical protein